MGFTSPYPSYRLITSGLFVRRRVLTLVFPHHQGEIGCEVRAIGIFLFLYVTEDRNGAVRHQLDQIGSGIGSHPGIGVAEKR